MQNTIFSNLENALKKVKDLVSNDGSLLRNKCLEWTEKMDAQLIRALLKDKMCQKTFFTDVDGVFVFDKSRFIQFLHAKEFLPDSYTAFKNRIGLVNESGEFIYKTNDVCLSFPFKDCVLQGGQTKDDGKQNESMYNEVLSLEAISTLLAPKAFCNAIRIGAAENQSLPALRLNADGTFAENFLIKGNNLIALHSLKRRYRGKVKLIYIDPPYNTGNDSFNYNDRFNHSVWLTFMKNRLGIARELLRDDGVIFVQCDDNEQAYLKVLMDEIFGRENFVACFAVQHNPRGRSLDKIMAKTHEYILCYVKNINYIQPFLIPKDDKALSEYSLKDNNGLYREMRLMNGNRFFTRHTRPNLYYPIYVNPKNCEVSLNKDKNFSVEVFPINSLNSEQCWTWSKEKFENEKHLIVARQVKNEGWRIYRKDYLNNESSLTKIKSLLIEKEFNNENGTEELRALKLNFATPKPEALIKRIIEIATSENDIVLDFFAGSGTTLAVAHKMKRRFIGIEQMDYIENITLERLKKVIAGEQGGVSKAVNWQGGGSFVYFELAKANYSFIEKINKCKTESEIIQLTKKILQSDFVNATININEVKFEDKDYEALSLKIKKMFALQLLDKNQLYVQASSLDDAEEAKTLSENDKAFTKMWYGEG